MTRDELRALVRQIVADRLREPGSPRPQANVNTASGDESVMRDASHAIYLSIVNVGDACLIEPAVPCNHCGYCKSHGH